MLDMIMNMAKEELGNKLTQETGLDLNQAEQSIEVSGESIKDSLLEQVTSGNLGEINNLLKGNPSSGLINTITENVASSLLSKLGLNDSTAKMVTNLVVPFILKQISNKGEGADASDLAGMLGDSAKDAMMDAAKDKLGDALKGKLGNLFG